MLPPRTKASYQHSNKSFISPFCGKAARQRSARILVCQANVHNTLCMFIVLILLVLGLNLGWGFQRFLMGGIPNPIKFQMWVGHLMPLSFFRNGSLALLLQWSAFKSISDGYVNTGGVIASSSRHAH